MSGGITFSGGMSMTPPPPPGELTLIYNAAVGGSAFRTINIPLKGTVNATIDWGDGTSNTFNAAGYANKIYSTTGNFTVKISGTLTGLGLSNLGPIVNGNRLVSIVSFGDIGLTDLSGAFNNCVSLTSVPTTLPSTVTNLANTFYNCTAFNDANITNWNVSNVSNMVGTFGFATTFNRNIGSWDVSNVTTMSLMFFQASAFNQNIDSWNVSKVSNLSQAFDGANSFNQPIGSWNVANVTNLSSTFRQARSFNQSIGSWNTINAVNMDSMFNAANNFNQSIGNWNVSNVTNMTSMFNGATVFNQDLTGWCVQKMNTAPTSFSVSSALSAANIPYWGSCPTLTPSSTITFIGSSSNVGNVITWPSHQTGDLLVGLAFKGDGASLIGITGGFTGVRSDVGNGCAIRTVYRIAANSTMPNLTLTGATTVIGLVYRGANSVTPISTFGLAPDSVPTLGGTNTTTITYPANPVWYNDSWVIGYAGHTANTGNMQIAPSGLTYRANITNNTTTDVAGAFDSNGITGKWTATSANIGGTNGNYFAVTMRLLPTLS